VLKSYVPWCTPPPTVELFMDVSNSGWGFHTSDHQQGKGRWKAPIGSFHINVKEFIAVWIVLQNCHWKRGTSIRLHGNNTSVVNCINLGVGVMVNEIEASVVLDPVDCLFDGFRVLDPIGSVHIKGELNALADSLFRNLPVPPEWMLDNKFFQWVISLGSASQVDLMAMSLNHIACLCMCLHSWTIKQWQ